MLCRCSLWQSELKLTLLSPQSCWTLCDPMDCSCQALLSMGFSRQKYWSGLLFPSPGDLPNSRIESWSPVLQADSLPSEPPRKLWRDEKRKTSWPNAVEELISGENLKKTGLAELDVLLANLRLLLPWPLYQKVDSQALLHILDFGMRLPLQHCVNKKPKPRCPLIKGWIGKSWHNCVTRYSAATKMMLQDQN